MRLNKFIANSGYTSRRKADALIEGGKVSVNGDVVREQGVQVEPSDIVVVEGKQLELPQEIITIALNKPRGYVCTKAHYKGEKTVMDLLPQEFQSLNPVGRLDKDSEGLLLLTNDGQLHHQLTHPSFEHEKEYVVTVAHNISDEELEKLAVGIELEEGTTAACTVKRRGRNSFSMTLTQGWNRQIRRMVAAIGHDVQRLQRVRVSDVHIDSLRLDSGKWVEIQPFS